MNNHGASNYRQNASEMIQLKRGVIPCCSKGSPATCRSVWQGGGGGGGGRGGGGGKSILAESLQTHRQMTPRLREGELKISSGNIASGSIGGSAGFDK